MLDACAFLYTYLTDSVIHLVNDFTFHYLKKTIVFYLSTVNLHTSLTDKGNLIMFNLYEIYTCNPETGERGWDIEFIIALDRDDAATFPNFDCVIMKEGSYCRKFQAELSRFPMTDAAMEQHQTIKVNKRKVF